MITVIGKHEVSDAQSWKTAFDADEPNRAKAGVTVNGVYSSVDNSNMITLCMDFPSKEALEGMMSNPDMQKTMAEAGVISKPEFQILNKL